ncbi:MAG: hypothetical protein MZU84_03785 [Sphingobacterium sp.]|nr:hypothetical protein [Sphingobacterium sp.]
MGRILSQEVNNASLKQAKKYKLLKLKFDEKDQKDFIERNINDTRYISKFIKNWLENHLDFGVDDNKRRIQVRSGSFTTAYLRHQWGLQKVRGESDKHSCSWMQLLWHMQQKAWLNIFQLFQLKEKVKNG